MALFNDGWADWEAGFVLAALREHLGFSVRVATPTGAEAISIGGVRARGELAFDAVPLAETDLLLVIGSARWSGAEIPAVTALLRTADTAGLPMGAICAGTVAVARAGLLENRPHTSNSLDFLTQHAPDYGGAARYEDSPRAVTGGNLVTASGLAPVSFAAAVLRLTAPDQAAAVDIWAAMMAAEHAGG